MWLVFPWNKKKIYSLVYGKCRGFIECLLFTAGVRHWLCLQRVGMTLKVYKVSFPKHRKNVRKGHCFKGINLREQGRWERRHSNQILEAENFVDNLAWETESQTSSKEAKKQRTWHHIEPQMTRVLGWRGKDKTTWSSVWNKQLAPQTLSPLLWSWGLWQRFLLKRTQEWLSGLGTWVSSEGEVNGQELAVRAPAHFPYWLPAFWQQVLMFCVGARRNLLCWWGLGEKTEPLYAAGGDVEWRGCCGKLSGGSSQS